MDRPTSLPRQVVVFDIDDTLYLERDYVRSGFQAAGAWAQKALGIPDLADRAWNAFESGVRGTIFDVALHSCGWVATPETIPELIACYRDHVPDIELLDDARTCLDLLSLEDGIVVAVVTDGPLASQQAKARALGLETWSKHLIFTEALGVGFAKPNAGAFELIERRLGVDGTRYAYIADNPFKDFAAPRRMGWTTIRVRRQGGLHCAVDSGDDVDHELADLSELPALLGLSRP
jgi:putative hydrolase of the HAD superfamily